MRADRAQIIRLRVVLLVDEADISGNIDASIPAVRRVEFVIVE